MTILAHPFIKHVPVESTAETAMLTASGGSRHDLNEGVISRDPNAQERVNIDSGSPLEELEDFDAVLAVSFFHTVRQGFGRA